MKNTYIYAMKKCLCSALAALLAISAVVSRAQDLSALREGFSAPPPEARPLVWWHWMNGNITPEGLRKDLDWMHRSGIAGFHVFDANFSTPQIVEKRLKYMSPEWKDAFGAMLRQADSLGMEVTVASSPGFSATGGPWVEPRDAMKKLVWREMQLDGGSHFEGPLPEPYTVTGQFQNLNRKSKYSWYEDIAVLAVRQPEAERTLAQLGAKVSSSGGSFTVEQLTNGDLGDYGKLPAGEDGFAWIQYEFPQPVCFKAMTSITVYAGRGAHSPERTAADTLLVSDDGLKWRVAAPVLNGFCYQQTFDFEPVSGRFFRWKIRNIPEKYNYSQMKTTPAPGFTRVAEFRLHTTTQVHHAEEKAGFASTWDIESFPTPEAPSCDIAQEVLDISSLVSDGRLCWDVPPGRWKVLRIGASLIGKQNHPASPEATGLEVDKLDPGAWERYFHNYIDFFSEAAGGMIGSRGIKYILADSYEAEFQNWTPSLLQEFRRRRGYDALPWLPVMTGTVLHSASESDRFLWDWRLTIGELFEENYSRMSEIARRDYGMEGCYIEAHANGRVFGADGMSMKRSAVWPMSEMWVPGAVSSRDRVPEGQSDIRESASVAHIYGTARGVAAESLTSIGLERQAWTYCPENIKRTADLEMGAGVNRFVIHDSAHQPRDDKFPGLGLGVYGQWFNRHECWAGQAKAWTDYLARSCYMLQQGRFVADVLWYYGENTNITALYTHSQPEVPAGYNWDYVGPEALLSEIRASSGRPGYAALETASGMRYRVLCIDPSVRKMSVRVLRKLVELAEAGTCVCGAPPCGSPSLSDDEAEFAALQRRAAASWLQAAPGSGVCETALRAAGVEPDADWGDERNLYFVHRSTPEAEIYWINNSSYEKRRVTVSFRVAGMVPEIWHPESGVIEQTGWSTEGVKLPGLYCKHPAALRAHQLHLAAEAESSGARTVLLLEMESDDAYFVVFRRSSDGPVPASFTLPEKATRELLTLDGPWKVAFQEGRGAPAGVRMRKLRDLSTFEEDGIKYFSGTAVYSAAFRMPRVASGERVVLDLGSVKNIAEVYVNGISCGTLWKPPFRADITDAVRRGRNSVEIRVTNLWPNRLIGDAGLPEEKRITYSPIKFYGPADPLLPSGLLGPVKILGVK